MRTTLAPIIAGTRVDALSLYSEPSRTTKYVSLPTPPMPRVLMR
ncbi:MAG: hypothetical protein ACXW19_00425 [Thermoanaerobaculia bacterium]